MKPIAHFHAFLLLVVFCNGGTTALAKELNAASVAARLDAMKDSIATETSSILRMKTFKANHTTVWRSFEDRASARHKPFTNFCIAFSCCSMDATSLNWVRQRSRL